MQSRVNGEYIDDGTYFEHLFIDFHLANIAHIGPGMADGRGHVSFFFRRELAVSHFDIINYINPLLHQLFQLLG